MPHDSSPRRAPNRLGYTIVELLAAMVIISVLGGFVVPKIKSMTHKARVARAIGDIRAIQADLMAFEAQDQPLPPDLASIGRAITDPWGYPYVYNPFPPNQERRVPDGARRDRFLVPLNSTFDLYSVGPDGSTIAPLSGSGADDIVRANDGGYIGPGDAF
jgi:general secretion pathway protein G